MEGKGRTTQHAKVTVVGAERRLWMNWRAADFGVVVPAKLDQRLRDSRRESEYDTLGTVVRTQCAHRN